MEAIVVLLLIIVNPLVAVIGPTHPAADVAMACSSGQFIADNENYCFYWQCMMMSDGSYMAKPKMCALGTSLSDYYLYGSTNPCSILFTESKYACHRTEPIISSPPECAESWRCNNGGELIVEADKCWCRCATGYTGPYCDREVLRDFTPPPSDEAAPCEEGEAMKDWCAKAGGCFNGGTCHNQCNDFWCSCPDQETNTYVGKRCENYSQGSEYK